MSLSTWPALLFLGLLLVFHATTDAADSLCIEHRPNRALQIRHAIRTCPTIESRSSSHQRQRGISPDMFTIDFECRSTNSNECNLARQTLDKASRIITSIIQFNTPVTVNATYLDFCKVLGECKLDRESVNIGHAYPAVSYLMQEQPSNRTRMYPQALLKQFTSLPRQVQWTRYDMNAQFNSQPNWYFEGNGDINSNQNDFLNTVIHEFIHGLGFVSAWSDQLYQEFVAYDSDMAHFLTPVPLVPPKVLPEVNNHMESGQGAQPFWGFIDFPLDRLLWSSSDNQSLSSMNDVLNTWGNSNVMFASMVDMVNDFENSGIVRDTAQQMYTYGTTTQAIAIGLNNGTRFWIETSFVPFVQGSSMAHVDHALYNTSDDFLMIYNTRHGTTLQKLTGNNFNTTIGPLLRQTLALLGYNVTDLAPVQPTLTFWEPSADLVGTPSNPSPVTSSHSSGRAHIPTATAKSSSTAALSSSPTTVTTLFLLHFLLMLLSVHLFVIYL